ncbi:hypothetical protein [Yoonia sp. I 8.24]|uniref:hypothetical protein n=1 Tax=Yoonia sp. I 8.24 TaxID=1537229 RepID=UPI001EE0AA2F|nr:hypothetical protein [Yoonia sp. I 8.24]MCG3269271.1 hypothetical protein [Yoonia sp. I 8.24]
MNWLSDITIFNESTAYTVPEDVSIYRTLEDMCSGMEPWMVEAGGIGFALNGLGERLTLDLDGEDVVGSIDKTRPADPETALAWLRFVAENKRDARILRSKKKPGLFRGPLIVGELEAKGAFPDTVEGLLAYIHL